jgi:hypothetical protein
LSFVVNKCRQKVLEELKMIVGLNYPSFIASFWFTKVVELVDGKLREKFATLSKSICDLCVSCGRPGKDVWSAFGSSRLQCRPPLPEVKNKWYTIEYYGKCSNVHLRG